ncbi:hypothetical protein [uncultured Tateyamaria sp.]|uniref:hypothetical protein n=1 Tax=uncultured Tateyamaria sp. TaxID=455651 RepID=UPI00261AB227|nr:hypothetical protein [uncultured Tateyamaria sp.]
MRFLVLALMVLPLPAFALSCMSHGVSDAYLEAANAEEGYVPVLGELSFDPEMLPKVDWEKQTEVPPTTLIPATFKGKALGPRGVPQIFETDVVLEVQCAGPWCPSPAPGEMLGFLRKTSHSYVLHTNACGGFLFGNPQEEQITELQDCLAGRQCESSALR